MSEANELFRNLQLRSCIATPYVRTESQSDSVESKSLISAHVHSQNTRIRRRRFRSMRKKLKKGKLITFEGIDASGKSTLSKEVGKRLKFEGFDVVLVSEPTKTWLGETVRRAMESRIYPISEALLFTADHANLVSNIEKWLENGKIVICDRYNDSSYAYQGVQLKSILKQKKIDSVKWLKKMQKPLTIIPDITFLLVVKPEESLSRISYRTRSKFEKVKFLNAVQKLYLSFADAEKRYRKLDATKNIKTLTDECIEAIKNC